MIEKSDYGAVEKIIKDAVQIGLAKHMGLDYWANPGERIEHVRKPWWCGTLAGQNRFPETVWWF